MSKIEWTDKTWNPVVGCTVTSAGCTNCYAMKMAHRIQNMQPGSHYDDTTKIVNGKPVWTGKIGDAPDHVWAEPLKRKKPTKYFVNSMGDLFHPNVPEDLIDRAFAIMALAPHHTFQILTKHPERMRNYVNEYRWGNICDAWASFEDFSFRQNLRIHTPLGIRPQSVLRLIQGLPLRNVWLGVSVEDQKTADDRIPFLLATPAAIRFVSYEPALGPVDFKAFIARDRYYMTSCEYCEWIGSSEMCGNGAAPHHDDIVCPKCHRSITGNDASELHWIITGGESGSGARPAHPDWFRAVRDQCEAAGTAFFFKQWGDWVCYIDRDKDDPDWRQNYATSKTFRNLNLAGGWGFHGERVCNMQRVGKKAAGRTLDGRTHDELPKV